MTLRWIVLASILLRLFLATSALVATRDPETFLTPDSRDYLELATSLATDGQLTGRRGPEQLRPPGYPLFLAVAVVLQRPYLVAIGLQALLAGATVYVVFLTALAAFKSRRTALLAAAACAVEPLTMIWSVRLVSETLFTTLLLLGVYGLVRYLEGHSVRWLRLAALALSAAAYVRVAGYFLPFWLAAVLALWATRRAEWPRRARDIAGFLAVCVVLLGGWQLRNGLTTGFFGFSNYGIRAIYTEKAAAVVALREGRSFYAVFEERKDELSELAGSRPLSAEALARTRRRGWSTVLSAPGLSARIHFQGMVRTLLDPGAVEFLRLLGLYPVSAGLLGVIVDDGLLVTLMRLPGRQPRLFWTLLALALLLAPYLLLPVWGLVRSGTRVSAPVLILWAVVLYFVLLSGGPLAEGRFRVPIMPLLSILSGQAIAIRLRPGSGGQRPRIGRIRAPAATRRAPGR